MSSADLVAAIDCIITSQSTDVRRKDGQLNGKNRWQRNHFPFLSVAAEMTELSRACWLGHAQHNPNRNVSIRLFASCLDKRAEGKSGGHRPGESESEREDITDDWSTRYLIRHEARKNKKRESTQQQQNMNSPRKVERKKEKERKGVEDHFLFTFKIIYSWKGTCSALLGEGTKKNRESCRGFRCVRY